jgi:hypothetical protein
MTAAAAVMNVVRNVRTSGAAASWRPAVNQIGGATALIGTTTLASDTGSVFANTDVSASAAVSDIRLGVGATIPARKAFGRTTVQA